MKTGKLVFTAATAAFAVAVAAVLLLAWLAR
jgi:hypothetical protein